MPKKRKRGPGRPPYLPPFNPYIPPVLREYPSLLTRTATCIRLTRKLDPAHKLAWLNLSTRTRKLFIDEHILKHGLGTKEMSYDRVQALLWLSKAGHWRWQDTLDERKEAK